MGFQTHDQVHQLRVMTQEDGGLKRQLFANKMKSEESVTLIDLTVSPTGMPFVNYSTVLKDVHPHSVKFKHQSPSPNTAKSYTRQIWLRNQGNRYICSTAVFFRVFSEGCLILTTSSSRESGDLSGATGTSCTSGECETFQWNIYWCLCISL